MVIGGCVIFHSGFAIFRIGFSLSTFFIDFLVETRDIIYSISKISNARFTRNRLSGQMHWGNIDSYSLKLRFVQNESGFFLGHTC